MLEINNENFENVVLNEKDKLVMVEFWAPWCTYCKRISSAFDAIAKEYADQFVIGKINIDDAMDIAIRYQVLIIPTVIIFKEGQPIARIVNPPSKSAIEELIFSNTTKKQELDPTIYDTIIIGGGPAGYTAALYCTRSGLNTLVLEKISAGGQMTQTTMIDNYPGFEKGVDGFELGQKMQQCAERFGAKTKLVEVKSAELSAPIKLIHTSNGIYQARTVVVATGANPRPLGHDKESKFLAKGIHYCAACDGMQYKGKRVAVIGGGNTAVADALVLSRICEKVTIVHRRDTLRATKIYHEKVMNTPNIEIVWDSAVSDLLGENELIGIELENIKTKEKTKLDCEGVFVSVGRIPATEIFFGQLDFDENNYIKADESTKTNIAGVYAVGDVRTKALRQVVTAVGDGATASYYIEEYLTNMESTTDLTSPKNETVQDANVLDEQPKDIPDMPIYSYTLEKANGEILNLSDYYGKVLLIVNTATGCGFTPQYKQLEELYSKLKNKGLEIIDIPCNQFGEQAPGTDEEIHKFCTAKFGTSFQQMKKSDVNGPNALPLYDYLKSQKAFEGFGTSLKGIVMATMMKVKDSNYKNNPDIKWNFTKFLVDRNGNVVERFEPTIDMKEVAKKVETLI